jgi:hypothetical protein
LLDGDGWFSTLILPLAWLAVKVEGQGPARRSQKNKQSAQKNVARLAGAGQSENRASMRPGLDAFLVAACGGQIAQLNSDPWWIVRRRVSAAP